jgi:2-octaprenylphenol hydroxylase
MSASIVICGSGIVGLSTALAFARKGEAVTLVGPRPAAPTLAQDEFYPRVYALSPTSQRFLTSIGVWGLMDARRLTAVQAMEIHGDGNGLLNLNAWQSAQAELAWIVESSEIERVLVQAAQVMGLHWVTEKFASYMPGTLTTERGTTLEAELFIAADGAQSPLRAAAGLTVDSRPYGATALVAHFDCSLPHQGTALQWFGADGVLALLPMPDTTKGPQVSMVWSLKDEISQSLQAMPSQERALALQTRLAAVTAGRLGALTLRGAVHAFPLTLDQSPLIADRLALAGDAAHRVHPLAGQGLNLGLGDVQALVDTVATRESFRSPGDPMVLRRYRRLRAEPVLAMRLVTDGLARLFDIQHAPVVWLRNMGMNLAEKLPFIKRQLISGASR